MTPARRDRQDRDPQTLAIYTDGGCDPNPGPGGWGAVLVWGDRHHEMTGGELQTTNNRMEMTAAIEALRTLKRPCHIHIHTDSQYLRRGITQWVEAWKANDWRKRDGSPVQNADLWRALDELVAPHDIDWRWLKGHAGDPLNDRADRLATLARRQVVRKAAKKGKPKQPATSSTGSGMVSVHCCGSSIGSPGPGGYAAIIDDPQGAPRELSGGLPRTSNNVMELTAAIAALESLEPRSKVKVHSLSMYLVQGANEWLPAWIENGWRKKDKKPVQNRALWERLASAMDRLQVAFTGADRSNPAAQRVRRLARAEAKRQADKKRR